ncbi:hypothetical protein M3J09_004351 [Ascochyta lentis]
MNILVSKKFHCVCKQKSYCLFRTDERDTFLQKDEVMREVPRIPTEEVRTVLSSRAVFVSACCYFSCSSDSF